MKTFLFAIFLFSISICMGQSKLTDPATDCEYVLPWTCDECTMKWSGDCLDGTPSGSGVLSVFHGENEIMTYEGEMENGNFNGEGSYRDGMNKMEGEFENGNLVSSANPHRSYRNATIDTTTFNKTDAWEAKPLVTKQIKNIYFTFPGEGYAFENRDTLVEQCMDALNKNLQIIEDPDYTEFTRIIFVTSKKEMLLVADIAVSGAANIYARTIHMVVSNDDEVEDKKLRKPPITHEMMHMVAMTAWGMPPMNCTWLNEGLATYAANDCSGYTVAEIYRFFLEKDMLIPTDSLTNNFYQTEEMIGYHQAAYITEYLISNYGIQKLEALWKNGFTSFENIYGLPFSQMVEELNKQILKSLPEAPAIDWATFSSGCE